jgi:predicted phosphodiesterase
LALGAALVAAELAGTPPAGGKAGEKAHDVSFFVAGDMRGFTTGEYDGSAYFRGACQAMKESGPGDFLLVVGDLDPPQGVAKVIRSVFGPAFPWYPAMGNHDLSPVRDLDYLRRLNAGGTTLPNIVRKGPAGTVETTYAFEVGDVHVAVINEYFDGASDTASNADISDPVYSWLAADLAATKKPFVFVVGHEPAFPQPDMATGRVRHATTSLTKRPGNRDRFWQLLRERKVTAFLCGHTHGASARKIDGVWQLDSGHARGKGDSGAPSTFIRITAARGGCRYEFHRADAQGANYAVTLAGSFGKE